MNMVFENYLEIPFTENYICQLHKELLKYSDKDYRHRGEYKRQSNQVEAFNSDGESIGVIFVTASPFETPFRMQHLVAWTNENLSNKSLHPLLIISIFVVEFLAIHPFQDGNGRLSRILTTYLLLSTGYTYVPYSSLEALIEHSKEAYYLSLRQTQGTMEEDNSNWQPWILFFLRALLKQKQRLETKLEREYLLLGQLPPLSLNILELVKSRGQVTISDILVITGANRNTIKKHLENLVQNRRIQKHGAGKGTFYTS
jgi:Fic family protein